MSEADQRRPGNCFVALPLEGDALAAGGALLETAAATVAGVRWVRPEGLHLTAHFFGRLAPAEQARVLALLGPVAAATPPLELRLHGLGRFPQGGSARVLWMGLGDGAAGVGRLAAACRAILGEAGFAIDTRPHRPHCTLGRPRRWSDAQRLAWEGLRPPAQPPWRVHRLLLLESQPQAGGSRYASRGELSLDLGGGPGFAHGDGKGGAEV
ncbi:MAG TPA: RNA 2',3'-cyclic phosphodiesterase [Candidatus Dormibacteraeota bacterium]